MALSTDDQFSILTRLATRAVNSGVPQDVVEKRMEELSTRIQAGEDIFSGLMDRARELSSARRSFNQPTPEWAPSIPRELSQVPNSPDIKIPNRIAARNKAWEFEQEADKYREQGVPLDDIRNASLNAQSTAGRTLIAAGVGAGRLADPVGAATGQHQPIEDAAFRTIDEMRDAERARVSRGGGGLLGSFAGGMATLGLGGLASGQDVIEAGGDLPQALGAQATDLAAIQAGLLTGRLLPNAGFVTRAGGQAAASVGAGVGSRALKNEFVPETLRQDPFEPEAVVGDFGGGAIGAVTPARPRARAPEVTARTGDPATDAGIAATESLMKRKEPSPPRDVDFGSVDPTKRFEQSFPLAERDFSTSPREAVDAERFVNEPRRQDDIERAYQQLRRERRATEELAYAQREASDRALYQELPGIEPVEPVRGAAQQEVPRGVPLDADQLSILRDQLRQRQAPAPEPAPSAPQPFEPSFAPDPRNVANPETVGRISPELPDVSYLNEVDAKGNPIKRPVKISPGPAWMYDRSRPLAEQVPAEIKAAVDTERQATAATVDEAVQVARPFSGESEKAPPRLLGNLTRQMEDVFNTNNVPYSVRDSYEAGTLRTGDALGAFMDDPDGMYQGADQFKGLVRHLSGLGDQLGGLDSPIVRMDLADARHADAFERNGNPGSAGGFFDRDTNTIYMLSDNPTPHLLVHEVAHAITTRVLDMGSRDKLTGPARQAYTEFATTFDSLKPELERIAGGRGDTAYGLQNLYEYMSEFYSNPTFRESLRNFKLHPENLQNMGLGRLAIAKMRNLYDTTVKFVRKSLGLPERAESALDVLFTAQQRFTDSIDPQTAALSRQMNNDGQQVVGSSASSTQIDTPQFKRWFGDSKVVDANGEPLVVYHGTMAPPFDAFESRTRKGEQLGFGTHFSESGEFASRYANPEQQGRGKTGGQVIPVYLSIARPLIANAVATEGSPEFTLAEKLLGKKLFSVKDETGSRSVWLQNAIDASPPDRAMREIQAAGYDGVRYDSVVRGRGINAGDVSGKSQSWIAFRPEQIKSATGNTGAFDESNPSILAGPQREEAAGINLPRAVREGVQIAAVGDGVVPQVRQAKEIAQGEKAVGTEKANVIGNVFQRESKGMKPAQREAFLKDIDTAIKNADKPEGLEALKRVDAASSEFGKVVRDFANGRYDGAMQYRDNILANPNATAVDKAMAQTVYETANSWLHRAYLQRERPELGPTKLKLAKKAEEKVARGVAPFNREKAALEQVTALKEWAKQKFLPTDLSKLNVDQLEDLFKFYTNKSVHEVAPLESFPGPDPKAQRKAFMRAEIDAVMRKNGDPDEAVNQIVNSIAGVSTTAPAARYFKNLREGSDVRATREPVPEVLRKFWGEIEHPVARMMVSTINQASINGQMNALRTLRKEGMGTLFHEGIGHKDATEILEGEKLGPLQGLRTTPLVKSALDSMVQTGTFLGPWTGVLLADPTGRGALAKVGAQFASTIQKITTARKYVQVIGNAIGRTIINGLGSGLQAASNGNINPSHLAQGMVDVTKLINLSGKTKLDPQTEKYLKYGIAEASNLEDTYSPQAKQVLTLLADQDAFLKPDTLPQAIMAGIKEVGAKGKDATRLISEVYGAADLWSKLANFRNEEAFWTDYNKKYGGVDDVPRFVADRINNTNITPRRASPVAKVSDFVGASTFLPYSTEVIRTAYNNIAYGFSDMRNGIGVGHPELVVHGLKRVLGTSAAIGLGTKALGAVASAGLGVLGVAADLMGDEDERRKYLGRGQFGAGSAPLLIKDTSGKEYTLDSGSLNPYDPAAKPIVTLFKALGQSDPKKMQDGLKEAQRAFTGMLSQNSAWGLMSRTISGDTPAIAKSNPRYYNAVLEHLVNDGGLSVQDANRTINASQIGTPKGLTELFKGLTEDTDAPIKTMMAMGTGVNRFDVSKNIENYDGPKFQAELSKARRGYADLLKADFTVREDRVEDAFKKALKDAAEPYANLKSAVDAAKAQGKSNEDVVKSMKLGRVPSRAIRMILNGESPNISLVLADIRQDIRSDLMRESGETTRARAVRNQELLNKMIEKYGNATIDDVTNEGNLSDGQ